MKDRLDLEQEILKLYSFAEDVDDLVQHVMSREIWPVETQDEICNVLIGLSTRLKIHSEKTFDTMCQALRLDMYNEIPVDGDPSSELTVTPCDDCECCDRTSGMDPVW
jgi:hypothetical protein